MAYTLTADQKNHIEEKALPYWDEGRLNLQKTLESLGIDLLEAKFKDDGVSGALFREALPGGGNKWTIIVNKTDSIKRKRFTIAHELGHYFSYELGSESKAKLDSDSFVADVGIAKRTKELDQCELEANEIAAELLMPASMVEKLVNEGSNIEELAEYFGVSESAMTVRLRNLGYRLLEETQVQAQSPDERER